MWLSRLKSTIILLLTTLLLSCSGEKRAIKKINKAVELTSPDFVYSYLVSTYKLPEVPYDSSETITIIRDSIKLDTIILIDTLKKTDTIQIRKDRMQIRIIRQNDTVYVKGDCVTDTIIREKIVYVTKYADKKNFEKNNFYDKFVPIAFIVFVMIFLIIAIVRGIKSYIKNNL
jgi:Ca2+/Na+ antiporter